MSESIHDSDDSSSLSSNIGSNGSSNNSDDSFNEAMDEQILGVLAEHCANMATDELKWGGSRPGKAPNKPRDFEAAYQQLLQQYFSGDDSIYSESDFRRRFRMERTVFETVYRAVASEQPFVLRQDCTKKVGIHPLVRFTACLRVLTYGNCADGYDETFQIAESTLIESVKSFANIIVDKFGAQYLNRPPTEAELQRILTINSNRGFPGLVACWDCKHFVWKNCPIYLAGQFSGKGKIPTIVLEAICDPDLFIYFSFFGSPGSLNDINILNKSTIVSALLSRRFDLKTESYTINNNVRDWLYFLVDGIYPPWAIFMSTIGNPIGEEQTLYKTRHEHVRKDIERAFGALVQQFQILQIPFRSWSLEDNSAILNCCVILHNIITESRRFSYSVNKWTRDVLIRDNDDNNPLRSLFGYDEHIERPDYDMGLATTILQSNYIDEEAHRSLKHDLIQHHYFLHNERNQHD